jgi:hypothetical protein
MVGSIRRVDGGHRQVKNLAERVSYGLRGYLQLRDGVQSSARRRLLERQPDQAGSVRDVCRWPAGAAVADVSGHALLSCRRREPAALNYKRIADYARDHLRKEERTHEHNNVPERQGDAKLTTPNTTALSKTAVPATTNDTAGE